MPIIVLGLDEFNWSIIRQLIYSEFQDSMIEIRIYQINNNTISPISNKNKYGKVTPNIYAIDKINLLLQKK